MRVAGEMHDRLDAGQQRRPIDGLGEITEAGDLDAGRKRDGAWIAYRGAHRVAGLGERGDQRTSDRSRGAGDENLHRLPRASVIRSQATQAAPSISSGMSAHGSGSITLVSASTTSAMFTSTTRAI